MSVSDIFAGCFRASQTGSGAGLEGLTVSGGEPFLQPRGLYDLLRAAREIYGLTTVVYTGFLLEELKADERTREILNYTDVLIDGAFEKDKLEPTLLARGSTNQRFNLLGAGYREEDFIMKGRAEVIIGEDGTVTKTGFSRAEQAQK